MNDTKDFFVSLPVGATVKFEYEGKVRDGFVNYVTDSRVNIFCNTRLAYRSFVFDKIKLIN